jgi:hypothetical protein
LRPPVNPSLSAVRLIMKEDNDGWTGAIRDKMCTSVARDLTERKYRGRL